MPIQYIPYYPEPIQGQALLNNFTRTQRALKYRDNDKVFTRILRGLPLYEMETIETVGKDPNGNLVIRGECVSACAYLKQQGIKVDLVYIDPPFASGADYAKKIYLRRNPKVAKAIEQAEQEMDDDERGFEEKMYGDIWNKEAYLNWMYENLHAIKSVMSETGSIYVHLDWHIGHYVKVLMDEIFGEDNFRNEIIWKRSSIATNVSTQWRNSHDVLLFYGKDEEVVFHARYTEYSESSKEHFSNKDEKGIYSLVPLLGSGRTINGESGVVWHGVDPNKLGKKGMHWLKKPSVLEKLDQEGLIYWPKKKDGLPRLKYYLDDSKGRYVSDVWDDITIINSMAEEALGYPTQKPESLLQRIIEAGSDAGMVVADFFGGSGVTAKAAHDFGRIFIHADVGINSIQTARDRLKAAKASFEILEVKDGVSLFRNPAQTMDKLYALIPGLGKAGELSNFWSGGIHDSKQGLIPVFLPNLLDHTQKVLDVPLLNRILNEAMPDLPDGVKQVAVYYIDLEDKKELETFIREYNPTEIKVDLRDLKEVLHEIVANDEVEYKASEGKDGFTVEFTRFYSDRLVQKIDAYNQKRGLNGNGKAKQIEMDKTNGDEDENGNHAPFKPIEISENGLELIELISLDCASAKGKWNSDKEIKIDKKGFVIRDGEKTKEFWDGKIICKEKPLRLKVRNIAGDETVVAL